MVDTGHWSRFPVYPLLRLNVQLFYSRSPIRGPQGGDARRVVYGSIGHVALRNLIF